MTIFLFYIVYSMFSCLSDYFYLKKSFIKMFKNFENISKNKLIVNVEEFGPEYNYIGQKISRTMAHNVPGGKMRTL